MIGAVLGLVEQFWPFIAGAVAILVAYFKGGSDQKHKAKVDDLEGAINVRKEADQALRDFDGDTRPIDDRLRDLGRLRDD